MSALRIAWISPWNTKSAIAQVTKDVADVLIECGQSVTILRSEVLEARDLGLLASDIPSVSLQDISDGEIRDQFDHVLVNVGNNYPFHGAIIDRLYELRPIGIFHDVLLLGLAAGWAYRPGGRGDADLRALIRRAYESDLLGDDESLSDWAAMERAAAMRPMTEWIARQCSGAVVHAEHYRKRVDQACAGPVVKIPLGAAYPDMPPVPQWWGRLTIACIGHANPNKRIDQLLLAVAASPVLRNVCRIRVIGPTEEGERRRMERLAATLGVDRPEYTGWVSDEELRWQLRDVDVISCLRSPVFEGASASLILGMASGRPTAVSSHGCYVDPPDEMLMHCRPGNEALDLMLHLEHFLDDPEWGLKLGRRAQDYARTHMSPAAYADALLAFLRSSPQARTRSESLVAVRALAEGLKLPWNEPGLRRMESVVAELTSGT
ncbi:glycosyltransferase involved in cell wall biosynthesis [Amorphus suaedae]